MKPRVGDLQIFLPNDPVTVKKEIQIDDPRPPPLPPNSSHFIFNGLEETEKLPWIQGRLHASHGIYKPVLILRPHGFGAIERGNGDNLIALLRPDFADREAAILKHIPEV